MNEESFQMCRSVPKERKMLAAKYIAKHNWIAWLDPLTRHLSTSTFNVAKLFYFSTVSKPFSTQRFVLSFPFFIAITSFNSEAMEVHVDDSWLHCTIVAQTGGIELRETPKMLSGKFNFKPLFCRHQQQPKSAVKRNPRAACATRWFLLNQMSLKFNYRKLFNKMLPRNRYQLRKLPISWRQPRRDVWWVRC